MNQQYGNPYNIDPQQFVQQAQKMLDPNFQTTLNSTLRNVDNQSISRGFYGQMPAGALRRSTAGQLSMQHEGNIAQMASQLAQQAFTNQFNYDQFQYQQQYDRDQRKQQQSDGLWGAAGTAIGMLLGGPAGSAIGNGLGNLVSGWFGG